MCGLLRSFTPALQRSVSYRIWERVHREDVEHLEAEEAHVEHQEEEEEHQEEEGHQVGEGHLQSRDQQNCIDQKILFILLLDSTDI